MRLARLTLLLLLVPSLPGFALPAAAQRSALSPDIAQALASIDDAHLRAHLSFLSDDMLEGRAPGTRGGELAAHYIATRFERIGLAPVGGGYLRDVRLAGWRPVRDSIRAALVTFGRRTPLTYPDDVVLWTETRDGAASVDAELVFVGFGIRAPEYDWDDYGPIDVRGKAVLVLVGEPDAPPGEPGLFGGPEMTRYARWNYKVEEAGRRGAAAVLLIHTPVAAGYGWTVVQSSWTSERFSLRDDTAAARSPLLGWIRAEVVRPFLTATGRDPGNLESIAAQPGFQARSLNVSLLARAFGRVRTVHAPNVLGVLPGSHPERRAEVVVFTAHYDHLGIGPAVNGDSIYNGAYDNASGVAALLEVAEALAQLRTPPERSILFLATTAEEAGLLGATEYVRTPAFPIRQTVAAINLDGVNMWGETHDVIALGGSRSSLGDLVRSRARLLDMYVAPEPSPETGLLFRTDLAVFARRGVPAIGLMHGSAFRNQPPGWGDLFLARWEALHYHRPSDEYDPATDLAGALQQIRLAFLVGFDAAHGSRPVLHRPLSASIR
jgi:Zn-dependent M28 family amino/carboxypeptidase